MRNYGAIHARFWTTPDLQSASDSTKLLALYLLTGIHTTMLGCFRLPIGYVCEDLRWSSETVSKGFQELLQIDFLRYDSELHWVLIKNFLKWNPIDNPNQAKGVQKLFDQIPRKAIFFPELVEILISHSKHFDEYFLNSLQTLSQPFRNQDQKQNQKQDQNQEQKYMSITEDSVSKKQENTILNQQAKAILNFLNEKAGRVYRPVDSNLKFIIARLKSGATEMDCRQVIAKKTREWKNNTKMAEYLRPATLFNETKFEQYMGELVLPSEEKNHGKP